MGKVKMRGTCPVCGHGKGGFYATRGEINWCTYYEDAESGYKKIFCMRGLASLGSPDYGTVFTGASGESFMYFGTSVKEGGIVVALESDVKPKYRLEAEKRQRDYVAWCAEKGVKPKRDYIAEFETSWANGSFFKERAEKRNGNVSQAPAPKPRLTIHESKKEEPENPDEARILNRVQLDIINRTILENLILTDYDRQYLLKEGWLESEIEKSMIRSFPEDDALLYRYETHRARKKNPTRHELARIVMEECHLDSLEGVPGAGLDKNGQWTFTGPAGLLIPMFDQDGYMYRLRVRLNYSDVDGEIHHDRLGDWFVNRDGAKVSFSHKGHFILKPNGQKEKITDGGKYRNFASYWLKKGTRANNAVSFYGNFETDDPAVCYITEGEKKAMFANFRLGAMFISLPGVNSFGKLLEQNAETGKCPAEVLVEHGIKFLIVAFDADKTTNANVLRMEENLLQCDALKEMGFYMAKAEWDISVGKGIDDCLANRGHISFE